MGEELKPTKSKRGGKRPGAGRPRSGPEAKKYQTRAAVEGRKLDRAEAGREWAEYLWDKHDIDAQISKILAGKNQRAKAMFINKLMDFRFGKPVQQITTPADQPISVRLVTAMKIPR